MELDCYSGAPLESQSTNPNPNNQFAMLSFLLFSIGSFQFWKCFLRRWNWWNQNKHLYGISWYFLVFFFHGGLRKRELSMCFSMAILHGNRVSGGRSKILAHPVCFVMFCVFCDIFVFNKDEIIVTWVRGKDSTFVVIGLDQHFDGC